MRVVTRGVVRRGINGVVGTRIASLTSHHKAFVVEELSLLEYIVPGQQVSVSIDNKCETVLEEISEWESPYTSCYLGFTSVHPLTVVEWLAIQILESERDVERLTVCQGRLNHSDTSRAACV